MICCTTSWDDMLFRSWNISCLLVFMQHLCENVQAFASNLARKHHEHKLQQKVWTAWHSVVESRWQQRVEKACQSRAEQVCIELTNDYETKLASVCNCEQFVLCLQQVGVSCWLQNYYLIVYTAVNKSKHEYNDNRLFYLAGFEYGCKMIHFFYLR